MAQINWTDQAKADIQNIIDFLAAQSETYAKIQVQRIFEKTDLLATLPRLGRVVPELEYENVREILVGPYRIVYHILSSERIDILSIHHSARPLSLDDI